MSGDSENLTASAQLRIRAEGEQVLCASLEAMLARLLLPLLLLAPADPRWDVLNGMRAELDRSASRLRLQGYESPYFIGYTVRDYEAYDVAGKFGAVYQNQHARQRQTYVEVRVGDYQFDNFANESGGEPMFDLNDFEKYAP